MKTTVSESDQRLENLQRELAIIWARGLKLPVVGLDEHFFDLGGHSLMIPQLQQAITALTGLSIESGILLQYPTVRKLAAYCCERLYPEDAGKRTLSPLERRARRVREEASAGAPPPDVGTPPPDAPSDARKPSS